MPSSAPGLNAPTSRFITGHPDNNVTPYIANLVGRDLHKTKNHPLNIIKERIEAYFATLDTDFELFDGDRSGGIEVAEPAPAAGAGKTNFVPPALRSAAAASRKKSEEQQRAAEASRKRRNPFIRK